MNFINFSNLGIRTKRKEKRRVITKTICLFLILIFLLSFIRFIDKSYQNNYSGNENPTQETEEIDDSPYSPKLSAGIELIQDPFTVNFSKMWEFFGSQYKSDLNYDIKTYFRYGDSSGTIIDDTVFLEDNLLLYKSLLRNNYNDSEIYEIYKELRSTPFWYSGNVTLYKYGFMRAIDNSTGNVVNDKRYLVDNLIPIFLLIETDASLSDSNEVEEIFGLINSTEFWDDTNKGFFEYNSSTSSNKHTKSNLYAILANILINRTTANNVMKKNATNLASLTISKLMDEMWDDLRLGFYHEATSDWDPYSVIDGTDKYLEVNALGIITLLEYWLETNRTDNSYLNNAIALYNKLSLNSPAVGVGSGGLWNSTYKAYENRTDQGWSQNSLNDKKIDLEANALMMQACLKLFEYTGNMTYYDRAWDLYEFFENTTIGLWDLSTNAYNYSAGYNNNNFKNFHANLKLCEAYLDAFEIWDSTVLKAVYNVTDEVPYYIIGQDTMYVNCSYLFEKTNEYYDFTTKYNFTSANITYIIKYPNSTIIDIKEDYFDNSNITTLEYSITEDLPIEDTYSIYISANTTKFGIAYTTKYFNVILGLSNETIIGLPESIYQGQTINVTLPVVSNRSKNIVLNASLEGDVIDTFIQNNITIYKRISSETENETSISFDIIAKSDANPGPNKNLYFRFKNGSICYLEVEVEIEILSALNYDNLICDKEVVEGESIEISLDLINLLTNNEQTIDLRFSGTFIDAKDESETIEADETKSVSYDIDVDDDIDDDSIDIDMTILKGTTVIYNETLSVEIIPALEVISISFPEKVSQGETANLIIIIQNNEDDPKEFKLYVNNAKVKTNTDELVYGENRIEVEVPVQELYNPYEFGTKTFKVELKDDSDEIIVKDYFEVELEISSLNLVIFYLIPIIVPIGIVLFYKNKEIKTKLLRR